MSYSAHRPGRFDSQGQISLESDESVAPGEDNELPDFIREYVPRGAASTISTEGSAEDETPAVPPEPAAPAQPPAAVAEAGVSESAEPAESLESAAPPAPLEPTEPAASSEPVSTGRWNVASAAGEPPAPASLATSPAPKTRMKNPRVKRQRIPGSRLRTLAILGGADGPILDRVPGETPRFVQMFFVLAGTALVSAISMMFALLTGVQVAVWIAVPLAIVWALIIFNLDRFLTSTMGSTRKVWRLIALALPRVAMAALIGFIVAEPVVLQVFHNDISREVAATNIVQAQEDQAALESGPEKTALDAASDRLAALQNQAATGIVAGTSTDSATQSAAQSRVDALTAQLAEQQTVIDQARALYQCELTGEGAGEVAGCTGVTGEGASSDAAEAQLAAAQQTYDGLAEQLRAANEELAAAGEAASDATSTSEAQNRTAAEDQLPAAQAAYDQALTAYNARADAVAQGNAGATGLLSQITGLNSLAEKEPAIGWAHWLIAALFFMIELLPVLVKVLTSFGDPSVYERAAAVRKKVDLDRIDADGFRDRADIVTESAAARA